MNAGVAQWQSLIQRAAQQTGVPASVIAAVMTVESGGNAKAHNATGATGLMQIMPSVWNRDGKLNLYDPWTNVLKGAQILAANFKSYGSWNEAYQRYYGVGNRAVSRSYAAKVESALAGIPKGWGTQQDSSRVETRSAPAAQPTTRTSPVQPLQPIAPLPTYPWSTPKSQVETRDATGGVLSSALLTGATPSPKPSAQVGQINWQPLGGLDGRGSSPTANSLLSGANGTSPGSPFKFNWARQGPIAPRQGPY